MQRTQITGTLPIPIVLVHEQQTLRLNSIRLSQLNAIEAIEAVKPGEYIEIAELAKMTTLLDENGKEYTLSYADLAYSSRRNLQYLRDLRADLDVKEDAENSATESSSLEHS